MAPSLSAAALVMTDDATPRVEPVSVDPPGPGEVLVRLAAAGVCRSDLHTVDGDWERPTPVVLGHEGAGIVEAVGHGVSTCAVGDLVVLSWLAPCGECRGCRAGQSYLCTGSNASTHLPVDGTPRLRTAGGAGLYQYCGIGTLATHAVVTASACVPVPADVPAEVAALIGCGAATGWGSVVNVGQVAEGDAVVVVGCGGVGLAAVMAAAAAGAATVVAVDRMAEKLVAAQALGANHTVLAEGRWWEGVVEAAGGTVDVALDCIGAPEVVTGLFETLRHGGTLVLVGMTAQGVTVPVDGYRTPDAGWRVLGSAYGGCVAARDFPRIAELFRSGQLPIDRLVSHRITLEEVPAALDAMRRGERLRSVVVF